MLLKPCNLFRWWLVSHQRGRSTQTAEIHSSKFTPERTGVLTVKTRNGTSVSIPLDDAGLELGKPVFGSPRREIESRNLPVALEVEGVAVRDIYGSVSRPFIDWFQAPRDTRELDRP